jgi:hypothetical protein
MCLKHEAHVWGPKLEEFRHLTLRNAEPPPAILSQKDTPEQGGTEALTTETRNVTRCSENKRDGQLPL